MGLKILLQKRKEWEQIRRTCSQPRICDIKVAGATRLASNSAEFFLPALTPETAAFAD
jgi:hypothetical protein